MTSPAAHTPQDAKRPRSPLAGPYGHPFHPVLVTIPIGAWVASFVFDVVARAGGDENVFSRGAYWLIAIGVVGALLAAVFGLMDLLAIPRRTRAFSTGLTHMGLNLVVVAIFVVGFLLRAADGTDKATTAPFVLTILGLLVLGVSGWLGGKLAYHYGVRVADEGTQAEGF
jgi:uncharacterized membrane protein